MKRAEQVTPANTGRYCIPVRKGGFFILVELFCPQFVQYKNGNGGK